MGQAQTQFDIQKLEREAAIKKELMLHEFQLNVKLKEMDLRVINDKDKFREDRKDEKYSVIKTCAKANYDNRIAHKTIIIIV